MQLLAGFAASQTSGAIAGRRLVSLKPTSTECHQVAMVEALFTCVLAVIVSTRLRLMTSEGGHVLSARRRAPVLRHFHRPLSQVTPPEPAGSERLVCQLPLALVRLYVFACPG